MQKRLLFLTLNTFSSTGGIEKVNRLAGKALAEISAEQDYSFSLYSMYDHPHEVMETYIPPSVFRAFSGNKIKMTAAAIIEGRKAELVLLSHINLLAIGWAIRRLSPKTKVLLICHGIEVWKPLPFWKKAMLRGLGGYLPVSHFTMQKMHELYGLPAGKMRVLNNCIDPFLARSNNSAEQLSRTKTKYGFTNDDEVLFTLTRLKSSEQYKGYDRVIEALPAMLRQRPNAKYLLAGKYDEGERKRLNALIESLGLQNKVVMTGFITDEEAADCFAAAALYIMPSTGEGFGIVFIEALFHGLPVIAGNRDGSVDALGGGKFGLLIDPNNISEIGNAVIEITGNRKAYVPDHTAVVKSFGFETYKKNLSFLLRTILK